MKYAIYDKDGKWLYVVHADSEAEALKGDPNAVRAELVSENPEGGR